MSLRIYNTLTRTKEEFRPLKEGRVGMYVCGVTVYDTCHIGHARAYVAFDVVVRYLRSLGYEVRYVRNFTDMDDKIIARAARDSVCCGDLTDRCIRAFQEDMESLGVRPADVEPRVTGHIPQIVEMVQRIIDRGHAYVVQGDVYYDVQSFPGYLGLSGRRMEDLRAGASERVEASELKRHPFDFALWKAARPGEPSWDSPWGPGRPGWHIECSTMSSLYLGDEFDIHGGGMDLIFPHHENERAQSWACSGKEFVRVWMHNGFVQVDQEKMSKSLGNFFTIRDVIGRFHPESLRYFLLTTHYRSPINFTDAAIAEAENRVEYLYESCLAADAWLASHPTVLDAGAMTAARSRLRAALDDDFNTAMALAGVADDVRALNEALAARDKDPTKAGRVAAARASLAEQGAVLGLCERDAKATVAEIQARKIARRKVDVAAVEAMIAQRREARSRKDFGRADAIRVALSEQGIHVMDTPEGTRWKVV
jgi:cysteinyl-tRNA synthetase